MKMKLFILTLLCMGAVQLGCGADTDGPIVELASGKVRGLVQEVNGQKIHFFQGIRYGQAKRFEKPTEAPSWTGIYDATKWRDACPQPGIVKPPPGVPAVQTSKMSEDCLMLNVWAPTTGTTNKTVIAFIHGGGFIVGTIFNNLMDGKYLASHDVVVVMMNYRLGAFGFLYGGTQNTPGNLGFHDVILALKWIKQNIAQFGGDPSKMTVMSESAGSVLISPSTTTWSGVLDEDLLFLFFVHFPSTPEDQHHSKLIIKSWTRVCRTANGLVNKRVHDRAWNLFY